MCCDISCNTHLADLPTPFYNLKEHDIIEDLVRAEAERVISPGLPEEAEIMETVPRHEQQIPPFTCSSLVIGVSYTLPMQCRNKENNEERETCAPFPLCEVLNDT